MEPVTVGWEVTGPGPTSGLLLAALLLGLRHGIDWDHMAAITDMTATEDSPRRGFRLGTMYLLGHAAVVLTLGTLIILVGLSLPDWIDVAMGRVVGVTLIALGVYVVVSLVRHRGGFRPRSRWMAAIGFLGWMRSKLGGASGNRLHHDHSHAATRDFHHPAEDSGTDTLAQGPIGAPAHSHSHTHQEGPGDLGTRPQSGLGSSMG
jgi:hypothetical protein